jgi:hypothetical protein
MTKALFEVRVHRQKEESGNVIMDRVKHDVSRSCSCGNTFDTFGET